MDKENDKHESPKEESFPTASLPDLSAVLGDQIGPYTLLGILGEGGFGIVYLAEQKHPIKRQVALKIIKPGMDSRQIVARFDAERQALALLDHPNIAHIFEAGSVEPGKPYFVMEYIKGLPITEYCDRHQLKIEERLKLFIQVCDAVGYAHQKGIIHRDIKPSNIIVTVQEGKAVPKVIDFGVAKAISMPLTEKNIFTQQGQLLGTPEYMSPEQADLREKDIDIRTDIYSLGVVLYELLAGSLPFEPKTLREAGYSAIQRIIREQNPPRPSAKLSSLGENAKKVAQNRLTEVTTLVKSLQKELEWIPLMAIRKERQLRYQTAAELARDIQNYMEGQPLKAGPESSIYRFKKFVKKQRRLMTAVASIAALVLISLVIISMMYLNSERLRVSSVESEAKAVIAQKDAQEERDKAKAALSQEAEAKNEAQKAKAEAENRSKALSQQLYVNLIQSAQVEFEHLKLQRAYDLLQKCPEGNRGWEWYFLLGKLDDSADTIFTDVYTSLDNLSSLRTHGKHLVYPLSGPSSQLHFWNLQTKEKSSSYPVSIPLPVRVFCTGSNLFTYMLKYPQSGMNMTLPIIDMETQELITEIPVHSQAEQRYLLAAAISPDDTLLATSTNMGEVQIWNINTGQLIQQFTLNSDNMMKAAKMRHNNTRTQDPFNDTMMKGDKIEFSPDGNMLGILSHTSLLPAGSFTGFQIIELEKGTTVWEYYSPKRVIFAFSPDSNTLVISDTGSTMVDLIDLKKGTKINELRGHSGAVISVAFCPHGQIIATGGMDKTIRLWEKDTAKELRTFAGHTDPVTALIFNKDPEELISAEADGKIKFWKLALTPVPNEDLQDDILIPRYQDTANNRYLSVEEHNGRINIWDTQAHINEEPLSFRCREAIELLTYSPDGKYLAAANEREIVLFNTLTKQTKVIDVNERLRLSSNMCVSHFRLSNTSLLYESEGDIKIWDFDGNRIKFEFPGGTRQMGELAISNDGSKLSFRHIEKNNSIEIWDIKSDSSIHILKGNNLPESMFMFDRNAEKLISLAFGGNEIHIHDLATGGVITIKDEDILSAYALIGLTVDNNLATINHFRLSEKNVVQVWDIRTGKLIRSMNSINCPRDAFNFNYEGIEHGEYYVAKFIHSGKFEIIDLNNNKKDACLIEGNLPARFSPDDKYIAVTDQNEVLIHAIAKESPKYSIDNLKRISFYSFFDNNHSILAVTDGNILTAWQAEDGREFFRLEHEDTIRHVAIDPNQQYLAVILNNGFVVIRNYEDLAHICSLQTNQERLTTLSFSPDKTRIITGGADGTVKIWDVQSGMELLTLSRDFNTRTLINDREGSTKDENAILAFTKDGRSIIHRSGNRLDLHKINEMNFKPRSKTMDPLTSDIYFFGLGNENIKLIKSRIQVLPNGVNTVHCGQTFLSFYVRKERFDVAEYLFNEGANIPGAELFYDLCDSDIIKQDRSGESIIKRKDFIGYLLDKGFQINAKTPFGYTPLHIAILQNQLEIAGYLIEKGADINAQDSWKRTPLTLYLMQSTGTSIKLDFINLLIKNGADVNLQSNQGYPPLYYATIKGFSDVVKILLESGARPITANPKGN